MSNIPFKLIQEEIYNVFGTEGQFKDYDVQIDTLRLVRELRLPSKMDDVQISAVKEIIMKLTNFEVEITTKEVILL